MRCLNCGKEIPEGRKFCSSSCSASYNNKKRKRKPWTEEQHQRVRKPVKYVSCIVCGTPIKQTKKYCSPCATKYRSVVPVLQKLGCWEDRNVEKSIQKAETLLQKQYFDQKESLLSLSKRYQISKDTIRSYISRAGQKCRSLSEGTKVSLETGRLTVSDSPRFKSGTHTSWEGRKFHFRSSWEEEYMKRLDKQKVSYLYEPFAIRYFDSQKGRERIAIPDFFFPEMNEIVELKSSYTYDEQNMKDKVQSYRSKGYKVKLLLDWVEMPL